MLLSSRPPLHLFGRLSLLYRVRGVALAVPQGPASSRRCVWPLSAPSRATTRIFASPISEAFDMEVRLTLAVPLVQHAPTCTLARTHASPLECASCMKSLSRRRVLLFFPPLSLPHALFLWCLFPQSLVFVPPLSAPHPLLMTRFTPIPHFESQPEDGADGGGEAWAGPASGASSGPGDRWRTTLDLVVPACVVLKVRHLLPLYN